MNTRSGPFGSVPKAFTLAEVNENLARATALAESSARNVELATTWRDQFAIEAAFLRQRFPALDARGRERLRAVCEEQAAATAMVDIARYTNARMRDAVVQLVTLRTRLRQSDGGPTRARPRKKLTR